MQKFLLIYLILINLITFIVYFEDKRRAKQRGFRISELTLIMLALVGGSLGALLAVLLLRHKTRHISFMLGIPTIFIAHLLILAFLMI